MRPRQPKLLSMRCPGRELLTVCACVCVCFQSHRHEAEQAGDVFAAEEPSATLQRPLAHPAEVDELAAVEGAPAEVQCAQHAHQEGRRGPGDAGPLQGPAGGQGGPGLAEEVRGPH